MHVYASPRSSLSSLPTDQHTISPAHARIYWPRYATQRLFRHRSVFIQMPVAITSTSIALNPISTPLQVYNYFPPYFPITVYQFNLPQYHRPPIFFSQCSVCSTPPNPRFACSQFSRLLFLLSRQTASDSFCDLRCFLVPLCPFFFF